MLRKLVQSLFTIAHTNNETPIEPMKDTITELNNLYIKQETSPKKLKKILDETQRKLIECQTNQNAGTRKSGRRKSGRRKSGRRKSGRRKFGKKRTQKLKKTKGRKGRSRKR